MNAKHTEVDDAPSIVVKILSLFRKDLTNPRKEKAGFVLNLMSGPKPKKDGDGRVGISPANAVGRIINALIANLFATNNVAMLK